MRFTVNYTGQMVDGLVTAGRGEDRWCMNAIAALLDAGHEVCLWGPHWPPGLPLPPGLTNSAPAELIADSVFLSYCPGNKLIAVPPAKFYVFNFYDPPGFNSIPANAVVTHSYAGSIRDQGMRSKFADKYYYLPHPAIPAVDPTRDNFGCKRLTWTARYLLTTNSGDARLVPEALQWVASKLKLDGAMEFVFLTGEKSNIDVHAALWGNKAMSPLAPYKNRVRLLNEVSWGEVVDLLRDTKLIINTGHYSQSFGGSPLEAASFGIPSVVYTASPFSGMAEAVTVGGHGDRTKFINLQDKLYTDHGFYREKGTAYRNHVAQHYTYPVFVARLMEILKKRAVIQ